jgi:hypothetical protein
MPDVSKEMETEVMQSTWDEERDGSRIEQQRKRVWKVMQDRRWHTLNEISVATGDPEASVSARLRGFRTKKEGAHTVHRRFIRKGLHEYQLEINHDGAQK